MPGLIPVEALGNVKDRFDTNPHGTFAVNIVDEPEQNATENGGYRLNFRFQIEGGDNDGKYIRRTLWFPDATGRASKELASINYAVGFEDDDYKALTKGGLDEVQYAGRRMNVQIKEYTYVPKDQKHLPEAEQETKTGENFRYDRYDPEAALAS